VAAKHLIKLAAQYCYFCSLFSCWPSVGAQQLGTSKTHWEILSSAYVQVTQKRQSLQLLNIFRFWEESKEAVYVPQKAKQPEEHTLHFLDQLFPNYIQGLYLLSAMIGWRRRHGVQCPASFYSQPHSEIPHSWQKKWMKSSNSMQ
jgi:hypothetical protein